MAVTDVSMETAGVVDPTLYGIEVSDEAGGAMGKDEFMTLLITEMQNQDPMDPVDNKEMIAQLAQFSSLEQIQNLNEQFDTFRANNNLAFATGLLGNNVGIQSGMETVYGVVNNVSLSDGLVKVTVGETEYDASDLVSMSLPEE
ncbi:MAG: hypothetical protein EOL87_05130 [Spartobacteria bacterium]|nr:hypothetical protein [Spartobacteria bacterium]